MFLKLFISWHPSVLFTCVSRLCIAEARKVIWLRPFHKPVKMTLRTIFHFMTTPINLNECQCHDIQQPLPLYHGYTVFLSSVGSDRHSYNPWLITHWWLTKLLNLSSSLEAPWSNTPPSLQQKIWAIRHEVVAGESNHSLLFSHFASVFFCSPPHLLTSRVKFSAIQIPASILTCL